MAVLGILFILLAIATIIGQFLLYKDKENTPNIIFIFNGLLGILLSWLIFTSLPTNFNAQQLLSFIWGLIALIGLAIKFSSAKHIMISKLLLTIAVVGGMVHLFIG